MLSSLHKLLEYFQKERLEQDARTVNAINAISTALNETKKYIEEYDGQKCADRSAEYDLSNLWSAASAAVLCVRKADDEFSAQLYAKSLYWSGVNEWTEEKVEEKKISFSDIEKKIEKLLSKSS